MTVTPAAYNIRPLAIKKGLDVARHSNTLNLIIYRSFSNAALQPDKSVAVLSGPPKIGADAHLALARLPTRNILRSIALGSFFSYPFLFRPGFAFLHKIATSESPILNPDRNPLLRAIVKPIIYDQFCAGTTKAEIRGTVSQIKALGFSGVILAYGKENQIENIHEQRSWEERVAARETFDAELDWWKNGNLETLRMIKDGDFLAIKFTGAGKTTVDGLINNCEPSKQLSEAMDEIAAEAQRRNCRIIIDAEQQVLQRSIDNYCIDLMRRYNRDGNVLIYSTIQAYLKKARENLEHQLSLAQSEGWTLAIKLVRGAYIGNDMRERIHDTKAETDECYDGIVRDVIKGTPPGFSAGNAPNMRIFIAGHNPTSVAKASQLIQELEQSGALKIAPEFGQLQGMADELGCKLLNVCEDIEANSTSTSQRAAAPRVYKYLTWGSVQECMQYLVRRAVENQSATGRMNDGLASMVKELRRRIGDKLMGRQSNTA